ncbi:MAG TPA: sugar-transfer associated ATP-grasp domain-containing protein [Anaerovoracaceae bacterium]|nr:sugar-transfer associated ATP-grasp domain-containing protein [Anaerovoracaceae bacterium]
MFYIRGRLNTCVDLDPKTDLGQRAIRVMKYYAKGERDDFRDLTDEELEQVEEFWKPYEFIYKVDPMVHRFYANTTGTFDPRFIPEDLQKYILSRYFMDQDYIEAFKDKNYTEVLLPDIKHPKTLVHKINGFFRDGDFNPITLEEAVELVFQYKRDHAEDRAAAIVKPTVGTSTGLGIEIIIKTTTKNEIRALLNTKRDNLMVQEVIVQHDDLAQIHPSSVNSIRVMSLFENDEFKVVSACLRVGRGGSFVDNWGAGGISCGIDQNGVCHGPFYTKAGVAVETHPDGFNPEGFAIPGYDNMIKTLKKCQNRVPQLRLISWDVSIDREGEPVFIEWNMKGDSQFHQLTHGPLYGDDTKRILDGFFAQAYKPFKEDDVYYNEFIDHIEVCGCDERVTKIEIPSHIDGKPVTVVKARSFFSDDVIEKVLLPNSIEVIEYQAFANCVNLETINVPNNLKIIEENAFAYCKSIEELEPAKSVTYVGARAFAHCAKLAKLEFSDELAFIGCKAFIGCHGLKEFNSGKALVRIEDRAFQNCENLESVNIMAKEIKIYSRAFAGCKSFDATSLEKQCKFTGINCFKDTKNRGQVENKK